MLQGGPDRRVTGVSIDSRIILPGELFLALKGKNFDGYNFAGEALGKGASGVIMERDPPPGGWPGGSGRALIRVDNAEKALTNLARGYRSQLNPAVIAITGSNGKTTTKDLVGQLLGTKLKTVVAPASYNNRIGVSLTVLRIRKGDQAAVFELGMNRRGEIRELGAICRPRIGVILNVGPAHIGFLGSLEEIASEKAELLKTMEKEKTAVLNSDDGKVRKMGETAPGPVIRFGLNPPAEVRAANPVFSGGGVEFDLYFFSKKYRMTSPLPGLHNLYNLLAALAVARQFGLSLDQMQKAVSQATLPRMRMETIGIRGATIINDAYNANPVSMRAALAAWLQRPVPGRRIMVSGDMNELGDFARREHRSWGRELGKAGLDYLIFVGPWSGESARAAAEEGFPRNKILVTDKREAAAEYLKETLVAGDSVLLKGSRLMVLETIVDQLINH